jgi:hypothetical protein
LRSKAKTYWIIALLGTASLAIYCGAYTLPFCLPRTYQLPSLDIIKAGVWIPALGIAFTLGFLVLAGLYFIAYSLVRRYRTGLGLILFFCALFSICLGLMYPVNSADLFLYDFQGRILVHYGENPYLHAPSEFTTDPEVAFASRPDLPAVYGPLWLWFEPLVQQLRGEHRLQRLLLLKTVALGAHLANTWLIWLLLRNKPSRQRLTATLLYGWNPLILLETAGNGHNDAVMMTFVLLAVLCVQHSRWFWVLPCLMLAGLVKYVSFLWVPLFALLILRQLGFSRRGLLVVGISGLLALGLGALTYAPLWAGADTFLGLQSQDSIRGLSIPLSLILSWQGIASTDSLAELAEPVVRALTWLILGIVYLCQLTKVVDVKRLANACFWTGLVYVFVVNLQPQAWYLIWLFPFAILSGSRPALLIALALSIALFLPYIPFLWLLAAQPTSRGMTLAILVPAFACLALALFLVFRRARSSA